MTDHELSGFLISQTKAFCQFCHSGPRCRGRRPRSRRWWARWRGTERDARQREHSIHGHGLPADGRAAGGGGPGPRCRGRHGRPVSIAARTARGRSQSERSRSRGYGMSSSPGRTSITAGRRRSSRWWTSTRGGDFPDTPGLPVQLGRLPMTSPAAGLGDLFEIGANGRPRPLRARAVRSSRVVRGGRPTVGEDSGSRTRGKCRAPPDVRGVAEGHRGGRQQGALAERRHAGVIAPVTVMPLH